MTKEHSPAKLAKKLLTVRNKYLIAQPDKPDTPWAVLTECAEALSALSEATTDTGDRGSSVASASREGSTEPATPSDGELLAYVETARDSFNRYLELRRENGPRPQRLDLALHACQVAASTSDIDVAQAFAQTAIDFMTGTYEALDEDVSAS
jgi:hypothetical protein